MRRRVAVTGLGVVTPFGHGVARLWAALEAGRSAARPITLFDTTSFPVQFACEVPGIDERAPGQRTRRFALDAAAEAWADAALPPGTVDPERIGVALAVGYTGLDSAWFADEIDFLGRWRGGEDGAALADAVWDALVPAHGGPETFGLFLRPETVVGEVARRCGAAGPGAMVMTSCPASAQAMATAAAAIRDGEADVMVTGGADSMVNFLGMAAFARMQALSRNNAEWETASRPYDRRRDGFVMGEGGGVVVLEAWESAVARGARIHAEWLGAALTCDAYRLSDEHPDGVAAIDAVRRALADAGVAPGDLGYVNAHGSSTPMNDRVETRVLHGALGDAARRLPVSSTKSMIGHLVHASAAVELVTTVVAMNRGVVPPTAHLRERDPQCDLDYVPVEARAHRFARALKTSFGFGGINAAVVLGAPA
ncbi:MAG TPA: beta-ketoacyl-[acyl-carrier-protein] synthase family protein [Candidatus Binatia bacterium]|nr:beta-ketoacyl-[acyl-carrier-protein] synthase family protein [Candidatus Binatia bacterium]